MTTPTNTFDDDAPCPKDTTPDWDCVDEASWESFPASDPPGWGGSRAAPAPQVESPVRIERDAIARQGFGHRVGHFVVRLPRPLRVLAVWALRPRRATYA